jgi:hypothetical protein
MSVLGHSPLSTPDAHWQGTQTPFEEFVDTPAREWSCALSSVTAEMHPPGFGAAMVRTAVIGMKPA